jgi:very-short-patch-repair endonuclease
MSSTDNPGCLTSFLRLFGLKQKRKTVRQVWPDTVATPTPLVQLVQPVAELRQPEPINLDKLPYRLRDDFLSTAEASFFLVLKTMTGAHLVICPKVSLAELFFVPRSDEQTSFQNKIDRKRVDFLLCDPKTLKPIFAIELDDKSHARSNRQERDAFVEEVFSVAGLPLVRVPVQHSYNTQELIALFQKALRNQPAETPNKPQPESAPGKPPTCPKCGVPMVLRTAKRGNTPGQQFYGCPNYPRCRESRQPGKPS